MIDLVFKLLASGLSLWESKEKTKYIDQLIALRKDWYEEYNKDNRDNARLDAIEYDIKLLCDSFTTAITKK